MDTRATTPYRRLRADASPGLRRDACLPLDFPYATCHECMDACPVGALSITAGELVLGGGCTGCGRCAAACPTGALRLEGFEVPPEVPADAPAIHVDCRKVPRAESPAHAVRVPCVEGLAVSQWLALVVAAQGRPVEALDRSWCAGCDAGGADLAHGSLDATRALLADMGMPPAQLPARRSKPLPAQRMPARIPSPENAAPLSRRGFLGRLAHEATAMAAAANAGAPVLRRVALRPGALATPERERRLDLLRQLATRTGLQVPGSMFANLVASAACGNHQVCAAVCPTGALRTYADGDAIGIAFEAAACIDCGACALVCAEKALAFAPPLRPATARGAVRVTRHRTSECLDCGEPCTDASGLCGPCRQSRDLASEAFEELFPVGQRAPA